jgi:hypothetical protein
LNLEHLELLKHLEVDLNLELNLKHMELVKHLVVQVLQEVQHDGPRP